MRLKEQRKFKVCFYHLHKTKIGGKEYGIILEINEDNKYKKIGGK